MLTLDRRSNLRYIHKYIIKIRVPSSIDVSSSPGCQIDLHTSRIDTRMDTHGLMLSGEVLGFPPYRDQSIL